MAVIFNTIELLKKFEKDKERYRSFLKYFILADDLPKIDKYDVNRMLELGGKAIKSVGAGLCLMDAVKDELHQLFTADDLNVRYGVIIKQEQYHNIEINVLITGL